MIFSDLLGPILFPASVPPLDRQAGNSAGGDHAAGLQHGSAVRGGVVENCEIGRVPMPGGRAADRVSCVVFSLTLAGPVRSDAARAGAFSEDDA